MNLLWLESPSWRPKNKYNAIFIKMKFSTVKFSNMCLQKPGSGSIFSEYV
jgi:hypothetical protein